MYFAFKKLLHLICIVWVTCSICAFAAMDPRFKTMALPEGTRLEVIGPVVAALRMNPESNSPFATGCDTRYSSPSTGTRSQFIIRITENKITNVKDVFDAPAEMLWSRVVLEGNEGCSGWVWMNDSLRFEDSLLHRWRALAKNPPQSLVTNKSSANAVTPSVSDVTIKKQTGITGLLTHAHAELICHL